MRNIFARLGIHSRVELARFFDSGSSRPAS
jgi:DNA-binding NarL/FixJ family response regulator